jgi:uncharacterized peroxidase-related enzyme
MLPELWVRGADIGDRKYGTTSLTANRRRVNGRSRVRRLTHFKRIPFRPHSSERCALRITQEEEKMMSRLQTIKTEAAGTKVKAMLDAVQAKLNMTPNMVRVMANSPAVLEGYLAFSGALAGGSLAPGLREQIALAVAAWNGCEYCAAAHTVLGKLMGLTDLEIEAAREGHAADHKDAAALTFARQLLIGRGRVTDADFATAREAGLNDAEIAEVIAHTALNIFTNYFNTATEVEIDFPKVRLRKTA